MLSVSRLCHLTGIMVFRDSSAFIYFLVFSYFQWVSQIITLANWCTFNMDYCDALDVIFIRSLQFIRNIWGHIFPVLHTQSVNIKEPSKYKSEDGPICSAFEEWLYPHGWRSPFMQCQSLWDIRSMQDSSCTCTHMHMGLAHLCISFLKKEAL